MQLLRTALKEGTALLELPVKSIDEVFRAVISLADERGMIESGGADEVLNALLKRERLGSTAIGHSVAIPHAYNSSIKQSLVVPVRLTHALNLGAPDGIPTRYVFVMLGPEEATVDHIDTLTNLARLMSDEDFRYEAGEARDASQLLQALDRFERRTAPSEEIAVPRVDDALAYTGRWWGGVVADWKRRLPWYADDFREGLHTKALSSTLFLFFACLAPAITFGGVMAALTGDQMGAVEMLVATAICGVTYALLAGQPLIILGGTGPLLVFTAILYQLCGDFGLPFLPVYAWVGIWTTLLLLLLAATDASCLMSYFTRFTDEIFSALISLIFIYQAIAWLAKVFHGVDENLRYDTALLSLLLALGTFYIAMSLSRFRNSSFLLPWMREFLADFGPTIALLAMAVVAVLMSSVALDALPAPESFDTTSERPWRVDLWSESLPNWARLATIVPALLVTVLVFLDQQITARLVNSPDHRLKKGAAYHHDLGLVGILIGVCSLFGLPWLVAATVRSLNHVRSLASKEEVVSSSGDTRERVIHVRETRLTGLSIHLLIAMSLLLLPQLKNIPMAVLYGLFLFMGVVSMANNQFFERLSLWVKDPDLYPTTHYIRRVPTWTIHKFTLLQVICLAVLWMVKSSSNSAVGICFPLFIALLVPVRLLAGRYFSKQHLDALDAEEEPEEEETTWT